MESLRILRGFTLFVGDATNLALEIEEMRLPTLEEHTESYQPGGSDIEIDIAGLGIKAPRLPFKLKSHNPAVSGLIGGPPGLRNNFTAKKHIIDEIDGSEHEHALDIRGRILKGEGEQMQGGKAAGYDYEIGSLLTYSEMWDGSIMHRFSFILGGWTIWNYEPVNEGRRRTLFG